MIVTWVGSISSSKFEEPASCKANTVSIAGLKSILLKWLNENLVNITPDPILVPFKRFNDRMVGSLKMLGSVFVGRRIAAAHVPAAKAEAQMHPPIARLQTILTALSARRNLLDLVKMLAFHKLSSFYTIKQNSSRTTKSIPASITCVIQSIQLWPINLLVRFFC